MKTRTSFSSQYGYRVLLSPTIIASTLMVVVVLGLGGGGGVTGWGCQNPLTNVGECIGCLQGFYILSKHVSLYVVYVCVCATRTCR